MIGNKVQIKKAGDTCETSGWYGCYAHKRNKISLKHGAVFPACNFAGIRCEGLWLLKREVKEKTEEEKSKDIVNKQLQKDRARNYHVSDEERARKEYNRLKNMWELNK